MSQSDGFVLGAVILLSVAIVVGGWLSYRADERAEERKWWRQASEALASHPEPEVWIAENFAKRPNREMTPDDFAARCVRVRADELERRQIAARARDAARTAAEVRLEADREMGGL